jgi:hypothetical protein
MNSCPHLWLPWYIQFHWDAHFERFCTQQNWAMWAPTQGSLHTHLNTHCTSVSHACYTPHLGLFHFILTSDQQPFQGHFHKWTWSFPGNSATFSLLSCISQPLNLSKTELLFLLGSYFLFDWFFFFETGCCYVSQAILDLVAQAGLELVIILPLPSECWDYRCVPSNPGRIHF